MSPRWALVALLVAALSAPATAGPWCGDYVLTAPAEGTEDQPTVLPPAPTVAIGLEDQYYAGRRKRQATRQRITATLDGKAVRITTRDVRTQDGLVQLVTVKSHATGKLELFVYDRHSQGMVLAAVYEIRDDATLPTEVTAEVRRDEDRRLGPYRWLGTQLRIRVDVPAIAFTLKWRRGPRDRWTVQQLPARTEGGATEARLGQTVCGMASNVPLPVLTAGIEAQLTALLPNGARVAVPLPSPLVLPPEASR